MMSITKQEREMEIAEQCFVCVYVCVCVYWWNIHLLDAGWFSRNNKPATKEIDDGESSSLFSLITFMKSTLRVYPFRKNRHLFSIYFSHSLTHSLSVPLRLKCPSFWLKCKYFIPVNFTSPFLPSHLLCDNGKLIFYIVCGSTLLRDEVTTTWSGR